MNPRSHQFRCMLVAIALLASSLAAGGKLSAAIGRDVEFGPGAGPGDSAATSTPPSSWQSQDIGAVDAAGDASYADGTFTVRGAGTIWGGADAFQFVNQAVTGDVTIVARVTSIQNTNTFAKAGIMIRESAEASSPYVILDVRPTGDLEFMVRPSFGAPTTFVATMFQTPPTWLKLVRTGAIVTASGSADGTHWTTIGSTPLSVSANVLVGLAVCSAAPTTLNLSTFDDVSVTTSPPAGLPIPWVSQDVGAVGEPGSAAYDTGTFTVKGSGTIWGTTDAFQFVSQRVSDGASIVVHVGSTEYNDPFSKTGVMLRASLDPSSPHVVLDVRPTGDVEFMTRSASGGATQFLATSDVKAPAWLMLYRSGPTVTALVSTDGSSWSNVGTVAASFGPDAYMGLIVGSNRSGADMSTFDHVKLTIPDWAPVQRPWTSNDVGATDVPGSARTLYDGEYAVKGSGTIWGTSDSFQFVSQAVNGDVDVIARLMYMDSTNAYAKAGIMIRESLAPDSPHVILNVRPTTELEFMTRPTAGAQTTFLATARQSPPAWLRLVRAGSTVTGYVSGDGVAWTSVGSTTVNFGSQALVGLAVCSVSPNTLNLSYFHNVSVSLSVPTP